MAAPTLSRELFLPGLFIIEIKTHVCSVGLIEFSEMSVRSLDFILVFKKKYGPLSQSALPIIHSVPLLPLKLSAVLLTVCVLYVCVCECVCVRAYQVCIKASSIQLMMEKEVPSSGESRRRSTPLYRCEYILFLCKNLYKCIHRHPGVCRPVSLMYCFFPKHIWVSLSLVFVMSTLNHTKPFTAHRVRRDK